MGALCRRLYCGVCDLAKREISISAQHDTLRENAQRKKWRLCQRLGLAHLRNSPGSAGEYVSVPTESDGWTDTNPPVESENRLLALFDRGDEVTVQAGEDGIRFLLVSRKPLE